MSGPVEDTSILGACISEVVMARKRDVDDGDGVALLSRFFQASSSAGFDFFVHPDIDMRLAVDFLSVGIKG